MFLTNVLLKRVKSKRIVVILESMVSGHKAVFPRDRLGDKLEQIRFDPYIQQDCLYKELKKLKSIRERK